MKISLIADLLPALLGIPVLISAVALNALHKREVAHAAAGRTSPQDLFGPVKRRLVSLHVVSAALAAIWGFLGVWRLLTDSGAAWWVAWMLPAFAATVVWINCIALRRLFSFQPGDGSAAQPASSQALVCELVGHRWNEHAPNHVLHCDRCNEGWCYPDEPPPTFYDRWARLGHRARNWWTFGSGSRFRRWMVQRCVDCKKPERICGRAVGQHSGCSDIPF